MYGKNAAGTLNSTLHRSSPVEATECPVAATPPTSHDQLSPSTKSVITKGTRTPRGATTLPVTPGPTRVDSLSTALTVGPQVGQ